MSAGRGVPRRAVVALAVVIIASPAAFSLAAGPYRASNGLVLHHHAQDHSVRIAEMGQEPALAQRIEDARVNWNGQLSKLRLPIADAAAPPEINFTREQRCGNNAVAIFKSGYHPGQPDAGPDAGSMPTLVEFNACVTANLGGDVKQGYACRVIGKILSLESAAAARADCIYDPTRYKSAGRVSAGYVDDFFGPTVDRLSTSSGSLYADRGGLDPTLAHSLSVTARGHALGSVEVLLDGRWRNPPARRARRSALGLPLGLPARARSG